MPKIFVDVELVNVAFEEVRKDVEAVRRLAVSALVVVALVVEALSVKKFPVVPHKVVIVAVIADRMFDQRD